MRVEDIVQSQLLFPLLLPSRVSRTVILWVDGQSGLIVLEVCDDVAPTLVVMDAKSDDEALAREGPETKGARRSTSAHLEHLVALVLVPGSTVGEVPVRLLDDTEERVRVGLVDKHFDRIAHFL